MNDFRFARAAALLATIASMGTVIEPVAASAQNAPSGYSGPPAPAYQGPPPAQYQAPPQPQYAPAPDYSAQAYQQGARDGQARYAQWATQNCVTQRSNNITTGAIVGGVAGVLMSASIVGWAARGAWLLFGGSLGLAAGSVVGANTNTGACPNGYATRSGAPPYYGEGPGYAYAAPAYAAPAYAAGPAYAQRAYAPPAYAPAPYRQWVWAGDHWAYRPYGYGAPAYQPYPAYRY